MIHQSKGGLIWTEAYLALSQDGQCCGWQVGWAYVGGAGPTWGIPLYDRQVVQLERGVAAAAGEADNVVLPVVDELGALFDVDVVGADIKHDSDVAFVLRRKMKGAL